MMEPAKDCIDVAVIVRDNKASINFYENILGLKFVEEIPATIGTLYRFRFGNSDIKLIKTNTLPPKGPIGNDSQLGFRYITFVIKNLSSLCIELRDKGVEFFRAETEVRPGLRMAMVKDPDGNIVEFVQRK